ncbi:MAG TPA: glycosyltransferase [Gemmatimonadaceae bacterium]|nr:glycosyltransferase [Gemmatimonadaceae bacterium]
MKAAYVGILSPGSTSRMRAEWLRKLTPKSDWEWIDTDVPFQQSARAWRTLAFRLNAGKAVDRINETIASRVAGQSFDLVWVDKGVFLRRDCVEQLRSAARRLVHYTPDTAFHANRSGHFESSISLYDLVVTTKSFEKKEYQKLIEPHRLLVTTQGFDPLVHYPRSDSDDRRAEAVFVGLAEPDRERCVTELLAHDIPVRLGGRGWQPFVHRNRSNANLRFDGDDLFGDEYAAKLSGSWIGLGLLSKRFPELHTTRTFEIPACGAVLATPATTETRAFFNDDEAIFFSDYKGLASRIRGLLDDPGLLARLAAGGRRRVQTDSRDYPAILGSILSQTDRIE